ncbi:J domain-containing protein [Pseudochryseolinea flava]|uniref:J domain-containing protein n=1 Tax=Pseudochryseolinea flava TaxID=2059302 RepID=A0A364XY88_9BACT|nr:DnaJ domain-containing protein [Pseudochryseolinea flava]RAV98389.1 hypothetical protein DQQ10_23975 [Pseudochryseolinea flava]
MKDYYAILGVSDHAHSSEIKRAYRRLAIQYHPDKNPSPEAQTLFVEINEAYDVLIDPQERRAYDLRRYKPFAEFVQEEQLPKHRDPRYRPKPNYKREKSQQLRFMERMAQPARMLNIVGLVLVLLFTVDYIMPYRQTSEVITNGPEIELQRRGAPYYLTTASHKTVKVYRKLSEFGGRIKLTQTRIFGITMSVSDLSGFNQVTMGYMYRGYIIFPLFLLIASVVGVINRRNIIINFNFAVGTGLMLIINYFLVF